MTILTLFLYQLHSCSFFTTGLSWRLPDEFRILNFDGKQLDFVLKKIGRIVSIIIIILKFYSRDCDTGSCEPLILSH